MTLPSVDSAAPSPAPATAATVTSSTFPNRASASSTPRVQIVDARCDGFQHTDRTREWSLLSVDAINASLSSPATPLDLRLSSATGPESILSKGEVAALLPSHTLHFPASTTSSPPTPVVLLLHNPSTTPTSIAFSFPSLLPSYLSLPTWASASLPSPSPLQRYHAQLEAHRTFTVSPPSLRLAPGESSAVTITHSHAFPGLHALPIVMEVAGGRWITLQLSGEVHKVEQGQLDLRHLPQLTREDYQEVADLAGVGVPISACRALTVHPIPIHLRTSAAPSQPLPLYNDSSLPVSFTLTKLTSTASDQAWRLTPSSGVVEAGSRFTAQLRFRPTQQKGYRLIVLLTTTSASQSGSASYLLVVRGEGILPTTSAVPPLGPALPLTQSVLRPGQLARLSIDELHFGGMCLGSARARVFVLESAAKEKLAYGIAWDGGDGADVLIEPAVGTLEPGERTLIRVELRAGQLSALLDGSLVCVLNVDRTRHRPVAAVKAAVVDESDDADIVLASSDGRFPVNHVHTMAKITGDALRFPTHPPIASRVPRVKKTGKDAVRLNALGLTGRVEDDRRRRELSGRQLGRSDTEEEKEQATIMGAMSSTYDAMKAATPAPSSPRASGRRSDVLTVRITAAILPLSVLEEQQRIRHRAAHPATADAEADRWAEEAALEQWREQFVFPPGSVRAPEGDEVGVGGVEAIGRVVRAALDGAVERKVVGELLPGRGLRLEDVRRGLEEQEKDSEEPTRPSNSTAAGDVDAEERRWQQRVDKEQQLLQRIRATLLPNSA